MTRARTIGVVTLVLVVVAAFAVAARHPLSLPATIDLRGLGTDGIGGRTALASVAARAALLVPAALAGLGLVIGGARSRTTLLVVVGLAAPITVFLVAQLNGMSDVGALVLVYAATAGSVLMRGLQERDRGGPPGELPLWFAAMLGIVPWGVVALHQVGELVAGRQPLPAVQVLTLIVLAATVAEFVAAWRGRRRSPAPSTIEVVLVVAAPVLLAGSGVLVLA